MLTNIFFQHNLIDD